MSENTPAAPRAALAVAKAIRTITVPPVMVAGLILILYFARGEMFRSWVDLAASLVGLAIFPVLAYPLSVAIPAVHKGGRAAQRSLAMYLSVAGYAGVFLYGLLAHVETGLMLIYTAYLLSVVLLVFINKVIRIRASGHGCSVTGPLVLTCYFLGMGGIIAGIALWGAILWASLVRKSHTLREFLLGSATCVVGFFIALIFWH